MASWPRTAEAGRADRLPDRGSRYFRYGPLDRKLVDVPDADMLWITEWSVWRAARTGICTTNCVTATEACDCFMKRRVTCFWSTNREDLASFLQIAMLKGWGGYILTQADYVNAFFSHDGYIDFFAKLDSNLLEVRKELGISRSDRIHVSPYAHPQ